MTKSAPEDPWQDTRSANPAVGAHVGSEGRWKDESDERREFLSSSHERIRLQPGPLLHARASASDPPMNRPW